MAIKQWIRSNCKNMPLLLLLLISGTALKAQTKDANDADSVVNNLIKRLSVSKKKAGEIKDALNYHQQEMARIMQDSTLAPDEKDKQLKWMRAERRRIVDSVLMPARKERLRQLQTDTLKH